MKSLFLLIALSYASQVMAVCTSPISRTNFSPNNVLTSTKLNADLNALYTQANELPGDCITAETVTSAKILNGTIVNADISASAAIDITKTDHVYAVAFLKDVQASGAVSQTSVSTTWNIRVLNTEDDVDGIVTLSSNQFTLGAGTYIIEASDIGRSFSADTHKLAIYNVTDSAYSIYGTSELSSLDGIRSLASGSLVLTGSKVFELRHYTTTGYGTGGFGSPVSISGVSEVYAVVKITKIK